MKLSISEYIGLFCLTVGLAASVAAAAYHLPLLIAMDLTLGVKYLQVIVMIPETTPNLAPFLFFLGQPYAENFYL
ncbi:hypothetical protein F5X96DRAFT_620453 [Biscogniauxia mediterranea]|nr:hypothetical protein F5X96DRAFT_620453 [Biscogniauxia mediterranea]